MATRPEKALPDKRYFRIGEVCDITGLKPHVLRYWETEFKQVRPQKTKSNQRLYKKKDVETLLLIKNLLYEQKFTIAGAKARMEEQKKAKAAGGAGPRQISLEFDPEGKKEIVETVIKELRSIRDLLDTDG